MSILIKIEMPKGCWACPFAVGKHYECLFTKKSYNWGLTTRPSDCPLIEIQSPHGRLIEEPKELYYGGLVYISPFDFVGTAKYFMDQIKKQPTIIEAEGSENENRKQHFTQT